MRNELAENFVEKVVAEKYWEFSIEIEQLQSDIMQQGSSLAILQFTRDDVAEVNGTPRKVKVNFTAEGINTGYYMISSAPIYWAKDSQHEGDWYTPMSMGFAKIGLRLDFPMALMASQDGYSLPAIVPSALFVGASTFNMDAGGMITWHSDLWSDSGAPQNS